MKKEWVRPLTTVQCFEADEYVAACGDENRVYKFVCNAPAGNIYAEDSNGKGYNGNWYHPCSKTHEAPVSDVFVDGFVDYNHNGNQDNGEAVKVWLEYNRRGQVTNGHATQNLNMDQWETAKS